MGSSGGGGGSSGEVDFPTYMKQIHEDWLRGVGTTLGTENVTAIMAAAIGSSPYTGAMAYDPSAAIADYESAVNTFFTYLLGVNDPTYWSVLYDQALTSIGNPSGLTITDISVADAAVASASVSNAADITDLTVPSITGVTDDEIISDVDAFSDQLDDEINSKVLPRFRRGMQDINAVVSSSFAIGESNIEAFRNRDVSRHASALRVNAAMKNADVKVSNMQKDVQVGISNKDRKLEISKANLSKDVTIATANLNKDIQLSTSNQSKDVAIATANLNKDVQLSTANLSKNTTIATANLDKNIKVEDIKTREALEYKKLYLSAANQMLVYTFQILSSYDSYTKLSIEANRIKIVANKEYVDRNIDLDKEDALWDLSVFQYGANVMASISGGTSVTKTSGPSTVQSAIGGGLSGAAAGAMVGSTVGAPVPGAIIGGVLGAAAGLL